MKRLTLGLALASMIASLSIFAPAAMADTTLTAVNGASCVQSTGAAYPKDGHLYYCTQRHVQPGGSVSNGDIVNLKLTDAILTGGLQQVSYGPVTPSDTATTIAVGLKNAINGNANLSSHNITAAVVGSEITITKLTDKALGQVMVPTYTITGTGSHTETLTFYPTAAAAMDSQDTTVRGAVVAGINYVLTKGTVAATIGTNVEFGIYTTPSDYFKDHNNPPITVPQLTTYHNDRINVLAESSPSADHRTDPHVTNVFLYEASGAYPAVALPHGAVRTDSDDWYEQAIAHELGHQFDSLTNNGAWPSQSNEFNRVVLLDQANDPNNAAHQASYPIFLVKSGTIGWAELFAEAFAWNAYGVYPNQQPVDTILSNNYPCTRAFAAFYITNGHAPAVAADYPGSACGTPLPN